MWGQFVWGVMAGAVLVTAVAGFGMAILVATNEDDPRRFVAASGVAFSSAITIGLAGRALGLW